MHLCSKGSASSARCPYLRTASDDNRRSITLTAVRKAGALQRATFSSNRWSEETGQVTTNVTGRVVPAGVA